MLWGLNFRVEIRSKMGMFLVVGIGQHISQWSGMPWWPRLVARAGLVSGLLLISGNFSLAQSSVQQAYLKATNPVSADNFGKVLAISGDTAVVGAPGENKLSGAAHVYVRTGSTWTFQAKLQPASPDFDDEFGFSVAIFGDTIVVGIS